MNNNFYLELKECLSKLRTLYSAECINEDKLYGLTSELAFFCSQLEKKGRRRERKLLLYCISTLTNLIKENRHDKIYDFLTVICNMPDIFLGKRNFYSFGREISSFRNKYGKEYFSPFDMITPVFTKTAPKNFLEFFSPQSDKDFKKQHPAGYVILIIIALIALVLPMVLLTVGIEFLPDEDVGFAFFLPAMLGCFVIGVGLFNIVAAFIHQYLGHALTAICFLGGGGIVAFSVVMMVNPHLYDNDVMFYYFISLLLLFVCALVFYPLFRISVDYWLKNTKKLKAPAINKSKKSFKDYLWYERLHKTSNLGSIYYLNKIFTIVFLATFALTLLTGYIKVMSIVLCPLQIIVYILMAIMVLFSNIQRNLKYHKQAFVLIDRSSNGGVDSIFIDVMMVLVVLILAYVNVLLACSVWGIELAALL